MDNVTHMRRRAGDQITTVYFVSGGGNEVYVTVKETLDEILGGNRYVRCEICYKRVAFDGRPSGRPACFRVIAVSPSASSLAP
jgi:hypothetical protein